MSSIDNIRDKNDNELLEELSNINRDSQKSSWPSFTLFFLKST